MAKSYNNLHPQVCSLENVMAAARTAMRGKMSGAAAARFHARWETNAVRLHEELTADTWRPGPYTYFDIHEPKLRRVAAAPFRDRVVHHALVRIGTALREKIYRGQLRLPERQGHPRRSAALRAIRPPLPGGAQV